jgi:hypothetical protein
MKTLDEILIFHAEKYPIMKPCDAVKLIYQNEFGAGHFVGDERAAFERLEREYMDFEISGRFGGKLGEMRFGDGRAFKRFREESGVDGDKRFDGGKEAFKAFREKNGEEYGEKYFSVGKETFKGFKEEYGEEYGEKYFSVGKEAFKRYGGAYEGSEGLRGEKAAEFGEIFFEDIGNGYSRLYIAAARFLTLEVVNEMFVGASRRTGGKDISFEKKLKILKKLTEKGIFSFDLEGFEGYLTEYESVCNKFADKDRSDRGKYIPVGHSVEYKKAYFPSYRIVLTEDIKSYCF